MKKFRSYRECIDKFCYFQDGKYYSNETCTKEITYNIDVHFDWSRAELFTGLFDKKGCPIFKGDILLINGRKITVEWDFYECGFNIVAYGVHLSEIIGNVHSNYSI